MKRLACLFVLNSVLLFSCASHGNDQNSIKNNSYSVPDEGAIKKAVEDAYAAISFEMNGRPRYDSIKDYFIPQAQLINFIADTAQILSIDDFVKAYKNYVETSGIQVFREEEIYGKTDQFGNIAQRISAYKTYINSVDFVKERGVNSFQLIKTPRGWRVSSIIWDIEKDSLKIPDYYLGK